VNQLHSHPWSGKEDTTETYMVSVSAYKVSTYTSIFWCFPHTQKNIPHTSNLKPLKCPVTMQLKHLGENQLNYQVLKHIAENQCVPAGDGWWKLQFFNCRELKLQLMWSSKFVEAR
jgi:hypothetical protein